MLIPIRGTAQPRLIVLAYDISSPKRSRQVRRMLDSIRHAKQYSVYEALLVPGEYRGILAELSNSCDFSVDKLVAWRPLGGLRLCWHRGQLLAVARDGEAVHRPAALPLNTGNFVICYDISDPASLHSVAAEVAAETAMLQRSVYWLRASTARLCALLARCSDHLGGEDRLWVYPLRGSHELWHIGISGQSILPVTTHHWRPL